MNPSSLFLICSVLITVESGSEKRKLREGKTFSFNTADEDIKIDLDFTIPFLSIPVKKTLGSLDFPTININPASLALGGAVVLGTTILVPFLVKDYVEHHSRQKYTRILENVDFGSDGFLNFANQIVSDNKSIRACALRISCWAAQKKYSEPVKFLSHVLNNKLLINLINSTAMEDAMLSGINGRDCMSYNPCSLNEQYIPTIMRNLVTNT